MSGTTLMTYNVLILILVNVWSMYQIVKTRFLIKNKVKYYNNSVNIVTGEETKYSRFLTFVIIAITFVLLLEVIKNFFGLAIEIKIHDPEESRIALISLLESLFKFNFIYLFIKFAFVRRNDIITTNKSYKYGLFVITTLIQLVSLVIIPFFWVLTWGANPFR